MNCHLPAGYEDILCSVFFFFFSSRRRHTRLQGDWSSDVCSSDLWVWFAVPHASLAYVLVRRPDKFPGAAARMYGTFDTGVVFYWLIPTAPPWWAAKVGRISGRMQVRRMMIEYGPEFWGGRWEDLYDVFGGNPLAAMPSLHFATSLMGAHLLSEVGPVSGAVAWTYAITLGLAL